MKGGGTGGGSIHRLSLRGAIAGRGGAIERGACWHVSWEGGPTSLGVCVGTMRCLRWPLRAGRPGSGPRARPDGKAGSRASPGCGPIH